MAKRKCKLNGTTFKAIQDNINTAVKWKHTQSNKYDKYIKFAEEKDKFNIGDY